MAPRLQTLPGMKLNYVLFVALVLAIGNLAYAADPDVTTAKPPTMQVVRKPLPRRRLASIDGRQSSMMRVTRSNRWRNADPSFEWRLAVLGGVSSVSSSDASLRAESGQAAITG